MKQADQLWFAVADPVTAKGLPTLNSTTEAQLDQTDGLNAK
jgi:hypothetical protein